MAYGSKYHVIQKTKIKGTTTTYRIELLEDGFGGSSTRKNGNGGTGVFRFGYDGADVKKIWDNPVQKGYLELDILIESSSDLSILTDIISGDEDDYQLRLKKGGSVVWTGFVIPDLITYTEGPYPFSATITAKDLHLLESDDYATNTAISYELYATAIADLLNSTGLSLGMHIYDEITASNLTATDDFFEQAYFDEFQLQNFSSYSEGEFEPISKLDALRHLLPPGFVVRQYNDKWKLFDLAHLAQNPTAATRYEYNASGVRTGKTSSVDLTAGVDRVDSFMLGSSVNKPYPALKRLEMSFNHKTSIQHLLFDNQYLHTDINDRSSEEIKVSDTTSRRFMLSGQVEVTTDTNPSSFRTGNAKIIVQVGGYEQDVSDGSWGLNTGEQDISVSGSDDTLTGTFTFPADSDIPSAVGEDTLTVELRWATVSGETVTQVKWHNLSAELVNGDSVDDGATKNYRLVQTGNYSLNGKMGTTVIGQGPDSESNSAIRYLDLGTHKLLTGFKHVGGSGTQYEEFVMTNIMNLQRQITYNIDADLWAFFDADNLLSYRSKTYFMLNGELTGKNSRWRGEFVQLSWNTGSDTFTEYQKISQADAGATIPPPSGQPSQPSGGLDEGYLRRDGTNTMDEDIEFDVANPRIFYNPAAGEEYSVYLNRDVSGFTGGGDAPSNDGMTLESDNSIFFIESDSDKILGWMDMNAEDLRWKATSTFDGDMTVNADIDGNTFSVDNTTVIDNSRNLTAVAGTFSGLLTAVAGTFSGLLTAEAGAHITGGDVGIGLTSPETNIHLRGGTTDIDNVTASGSDLSTDWNNNALFKIDQTSSGGNALAFSVSGVANDRRAYIQSGHTDGATSNVLGDLFLNPFGGGVGIGDTSMQGYTALYANGTTGLNGLLTVHDDIDPNANYTSNIGSAAKKFLTAHIAELRAELMTIEERRVTTGGRFNVGIGNVLASDLSAGATTISVEYDNLNNGDIIHLEKVGQVEFISVDSAASGTGPYSYDITRNLDGTGANAWTAGDGIFNTGQSGSGFIDMYATTSLLTGVTTDGPTTAYMQRTGATYNDIDVRAASGNIKGWYGVGSDEFGFAAGKYDSGNGNYITLTDQQGDLQIDTWNLETTTLILESTTPKLAMGSAAASLGLSSTSDTGTFVNGSGHWRAGTTDGSGNISKGFKFDGSNAILKANNAEIDTTSGWFGASDILAYSASSVTLAAFTAGSERLTDGNVYIGSNLISVDTAGAGEIYIGDWGTMGTDPRIRMRGTSGSALFQIRDADSTALDSAGNRVFKIDLSGSDEHKVGGAYFDDVDLWLGNLSKGSATLLLDGTNGFIDTGSVGQLFVAGETKADNTPNDTAPVTIRTSEWQTTVSSQSDGAFDNEQVKVRASFIKRFGADMITIRGYARQVGTGPAPPGGTVIERTSLIWVDCTPIDTQDGSLLTGSRVQNSVEISSTNQIHFELTLDMSGFTNNELHIIRIRTEAIVDITSGDGSTYGTETYLRFDVSGQTSSS